LVVGGLVDFAFSQTWGYFNIISDKKQLKSVWKKSELRSQELEDFRRITGGGNRDVNDPADRPQG